MADDVKNAIEKNAKGPRPAKGEVGEVQQHSLKDQVEADRYLASREAGQKPTQALRFTKLPPLGDNATGVSLSRAGAGAS